MSPRDLSPEERGRWRKRLQILAVACVPLTVAVAPVALLTDASAGLMASLILGVLVLAWALALRWRIVPRTRENLVLLALVGLGQGLAILTAAFGY
ncbi:MULTISPECIES: hypothetical protein [Pimelobacter]|uniref:hypothetical protein n=1 Tax=Pimelobacter TaxID=2044 RepID=UPI001C040DD2|nr:MULTISPECIES: hypothetical protein [Pimelobacter]MBU2698823.1 hypothetical protein [Pimelobacter sp. 30-1]UUW93013.1 hypothetical protein M0M43_30735 [Pimelobacter simplex]UUW99046.1 hypothetical protein M0M48_30755 [Pimelobacter simplex]